MLWVSAGTAGELIKIFPILRLASQRDLPWFVLATGQSGVNFWRQWDDFALPRARAAALIETVRDLQRTVEAFSWFTRSVLELTARRLRARIHAATGSAPGARDTWLVHGDTLSSMVGAGCGRRLGVTVGHVEAGLRSGRLLSPFPEEIARRVVSRLAHFHFAPDEPAAENLRRHGAGGNVVCTHGNTLADAVHDVLEGAGNAHADSGGSIGSIGRIGSVGSVGSVGSAGPYVVANLHRFENLNHPGRWRRLVDVMVRAAAERRVLLVMHPPTEKKIADDAWARDRLDAAGVERTPRQLFTKFIRLLAGADYVISDGGSNQEECYYLGKPCLLLRDTTERREGLFGPCVLSRFDEAVISDFLASPKRFAAPPAMPPRSPSAAILDALS